MTETQSPPVSPETSPGDFTSAPVPLRIDNALLSFALYIAGVPEWCPPTNSYSEAILSKLGFKGMELEEGAKVAWERAQRDPNFRGHVEYTIEKTPELDYLLKAFTDQEKICAEPGTKSDSGEAIREIMRKAAGRLDEGETVMDEREALLRIAVILLKVRPAFTSRWKSKDAARIEIPMPGSPKDVGSAIVGNKRVRTMQYPGKRSVPLFSSAEFKKKAGVA